jgi:hypothetical protein
MCRNDREAYGLSTNREVTTMFEYLVMFLALCAVGRIARRETVAVRCLRMTTPPQEK